MREVKFKVACVALYNSALLVPDDVGDSDEDILEYIRDNLLEAPVEDIEWLDDFDDPSESVTREDIISVERIDD